MPTFLLSLLANRQVWTGLGLAALLGFAGLQTARLAHAKTDLSAARTALIDPATRLSWQAKAVAAAAALETCHASLGQLNTSLADQAAAVAAMKSDGDAASATARRAVQKAQDQAKDDDARAGALLAARPGAPSCSAADALILGSLDP